MRDHAARFFAALLWVHVPVVAIVAATSGMPVAATLRLTAGMALAAFLGTWAALAWNGDWRARYTIATALTAAPVLMVAASANAPWQVDYHMYFFAVFGMLVAFVDWRPIALSAAFSALDHLILARTFPQAVLPDASYARVGLVILVLADGLVLFWIVRQMTRLFKEAAMSLHVAQDELHNAQLLRAVALNVNDAIIITEIPRGAGGALDGKKRRVTFVNEAFTRMTQYEAADVLGSTLAVLSGERTDPLASDVLFDTVIATGAGSYTNFWYARDGRKIEIETSMVGIKSEANALITFAVVRDVTLIRRARDVLLRATIAHETNTSLVQETSERHLAEKRLAFAAVHDELTRLPNRPLFPRTAQRTTRPLRRGRTRARGAVHRSRPLQTHQRRARPP